MKDQREVSLGGVLQDLCEVSRWDPLARSALLIGSVHRILFNLFTSSLTVLKKKVIPELQIGKEDMAIIAMSTNYRTERIAMQKDT